jgi:hypothetical protein
MWTVSLHPHVMVAAAAGILEVIESGGAVAGCWIHGVRGER